MVGFDIERHVYGALQAFTSVGLLWLGFGLFVCPDGRMGGKLLGCCSIIAAFILGVRALFFLAG